MSSEPEPISSESDDSDSDGGYLHPLLCGDAKKITKFETPSENGFIGPSQKPKPTMKKSNSSACDLDLLIQKFHRSDDVRNFFDF